MFYFLLKFSLKLENPKLTRETRFDFYNKQNSNGKKYVNKKEENLNKYLDEKSSRGSFFFNVSFHYGT